MNKINIERAKKIALSSGISAEFTLHEDSGKTTAQAVKALGIPADSIIKTLILYASKEAKYIGVIILGIDKLDQKKTARIAKVKKIRFATSSQIEKLTGFSIGGVPPTAVKFCDAFYIDENVISKEVVVGAGGDEHCGMKFSPKEFVNKMNLKIEELSL